MIGHEYKSHHVVSHCECNNSSGTRECLQRCEVSDDGLHGTLYGHGVYRGYLTQG